MLCRGCLRWVQGHSPVRGNMAPLRSKFSMFWMLVVLTAHVTEGIGKPKLIGDEEACGSSNNNDNTLSLRSTKSFGVGGPEPGDIADAFMVRTLDGEFRYKPGVLRGPLIIHAFTNKSGFLECLWSSESSLSSLVQDLPDSAQVLFLSLDDSAVTDALWMRDQLHRAAVQRWPGEEALLQGNVLCWRAAQSSGSSSNAILLKYPQYK